MSLPAELYINLREVFSAKFAFFLESIAFFLEIFVWIEVKINKESTDLTNKDYPY